MKPYYEHNGITIYHGDCREVLPTLPDQSIDLVLTDPPYGVDKASWDIDVWPLLDTAAAQCSRVLTNRGVCFWFTSTRFLPETLEIVRRHIPYRWLFIWHENNSMQHGDLGFAKHTPAFVLSHGKAWRSMPDLFSCPIITGLPHVTPKPLSLIRYIAEHAGKPNETILDPFMGSGTTLRAAKDLGRKAIGIEIEEKYCEIAARRLQQEVLFT
jgi:site-specific DNA-methyltransferase (adenine-specific)